MNKFKEDFDYKYIIPENYSLVHNLDFTILSEDKWFMHHIKMNLGYTIPEKCRCGILTRTSDPSIILTIEDYQKAISKLLSNIPEMFMFLFSSIHWRDIRVQYTIFPEEFIHDSNLTKFLFDNQVFSINYKTSEKNNEMYAMGGSINDYPTISRLKW